MGALASWVYPPRFPLALARKDADLVMQSASALGVDARFARAAQSWLADAEKAGWTDSDYTVVLARILGSH